MYDQDIIEAIRAVPTTEQLNYFLENLYTKGNFSEELMIVAIIYMKRFCNKN